MLTKLTDCAGATAALGVVFPGLIDALLAAFPPPPLLVVGPDTLAVVVSMGAFPSETGGRGVASEPTALRTAFA